MPSKSEVYIAGVGYSPSGKSSVASLVSAATKALLDAGISYDDVTHGVKSKSSSDGSKAFKTFDEGGIKINDVENGSELRKGFDLVKDSSAQCVLAISTEKSSAVAFLLVSEDFLWRHPYLKDSSALIRQSGNQSSKSEREAKEGLYDLCKTVWQLRGWSDSKSSGGKNELLYYKTKSNETFELSRSDGKDIPSWKEVEHRPDGKHRLGYNPATKTNEISQEDLEAVRAISKGKHKSADSTTFKRKGGDRAALAKL